MKLYDTDGALALLPPLVGPDTIVIGFQNGVETVDTLSRAVGAAHTAGGVVVRLGGDRRAGVIRHTAMDHLIFGKPDGSRSPQLEALLEACRPAGFQSTLSADITVDIWTKFVRLSVFSGMTAVTRSPIGVIVNDPELLEMLKAAVRETLGGRAREGGRGRRHDRRGRRQRVQGAAAAGEGVDARGSRARAPARAAVAERRRGAHRTAKSACRRRSTRSSTRC